jgi:carnitine-CoA ligase
MVAKTARRWPALHTFTGCDVPWLLDQQAAARPDKIFLIWEPFEGERLSWTFKQFSDESRAFAAGFAAHGISAGDFVTIHMENSPEFLFAFFACLRLGAVAVTTNTGSTAEELSYFLADSRSTFLLTQPHFAPMLSQVPTHRLSWVACTAAMSVNQREQEKLPASWKHFQDLRGDASAHIQRSPEPMRPSHVQYTSGTTSRPKGVVWTHANALWGAKVTTSHGQLVTTDVVPIFFPLFHANALAYTLLPTLWSGGTVVLTPKFSASRFWDVCLRNGCTWANMVMFTIRAIENQPVPSGHRFRFWALLAQIPAVREKWNISSISWYGMTETITQNIHSFFSFDTPPGAIGHPAHEYEIEVRDPNGVPTESDTPGRLWIRGVPGLSMFLEYLNKPAETDASFDAEGWFDTGDTVRPDAGGHIHFLNRAKDMLRVGEENVAASEIEAVINRVEGVIECAVIGRPDIMLDEVPVAFVVAKNPSEQLTARINALCTEVLARFKRPQEILFVDELPKGLLDKTLKRTLRERIKAVSPGNQNTIDADPAPP